MYFWIRIWIYTLIFNEVMFILQNYFTRKRLEQFRRFFRGVGNSSLRRKKDFGVFFFFFLLQRCPPRVPIFELPFFADGVLLLKVVAPGRSHHPSPWPKKKKKNRFENFRQASIFYSIIEEQIYSRTYNMNVSIRDSQTLSSGDFFDHLEDSYLLLIVNVHTGEALHYVENKCASKLLLHVL